MVKESFLYDIANYKSLRGNDLRLLLFCIGRDVYPQQAVTELGWLKQNVSGTAKRLKDFGLLEINDYPVYYRTNLSWKCPDLPGQMTMKNL